MRSHLIVWPTALLAVSSLSWTGLAETVQEPNAFDPQDLSGFWHLTDGHRSISADVPPMTPAGEAQLDTTRPTRGRYAGEPLNGEHRGFVRAVRRPGDGNDPTHQCNPNGFPRLILDPEPVEFIQFEDRLVQLFQWEHTLRELWTDGRAVPSGEDLLDLGPAWYGHSAGEWQGDTFVVQTVGLDDRTWMDIFGFQKSIDARFEERYRRTGVDTIEFELTLFDPTYYTTPWVSDTKVFSRIPRDELTYFGWFGLFGGITEATCAPMNEVDYFNTRVRDPGSFGVGN